MCWCCPQDLEFGHFTLLFCRERQRNVPKCKTHVQVIVLLIKTYCFAAFSSSSPSWFRKIPNIIILDRSEHFLDVIFFALVRKEQMFPSLAARETLVFGSKLCASEASKNPTYELEHIGSCHAMREPLTDC